ncbi:MAG TPA: histidine kinase dimerization/phosphoacceptor domain-containing protein [Arachnia sp.]|nr:histidine kinase dimerization/phosphoacceptor domain-containing protein [Arachnia sp.]HMT84952.1 histidine kinase dimerization/phosphoacceptor domain-containing protein [Arachnia sp.]
MRELDAERPWVLDLVLALALLVAALLAIEPTHSSRITATLTIAIAACYAWRRRFPLTVLVVSGTLVVAMIGLGFSTAVIGSGLFLVAYTVAAHRPLRPMLWGAGFCLVLLLVVVVAFSPQMSLGEGATNLALFVGAFVLGRGARTHRAALRLEAERAVLVEQAARERSRVALAEERLTIARELHDVTGQSLAVIALQAGVGARVVEDDPTEARAAFDAIAETSRESLRQVRQLLDTLRDDPPDADLSGGPS